MGLILDTCVLIRAEKNVKQVDFKKWEHYGEAYISAITVSELLVGVHCADNEARRIKRSVFVEEIIKHITALDFTADVARVHAELHAYLLNNGNTIGSHDLIIAATAIANGYPLLTTNLKEFNRIPGLQVLKFEN
jgi:tRNA(fMet)-specific endonuclease VapC